MEYQLIFLLEIIYLPEHIFHATLLRIRFSKNYRSKLNKNVWFFYERVSWEKLVELQVVWVIAWPLFLCLSPICHFISFKGLAHQNKWRVFIQKSVRLYVLFFYFSLENCAFCLMKQPANLIKLQVYVLYVSWLFLYHPNSFDFNISIN